MKKLITQNPKILGGKPIIAGTRMSVEVILEFLAGGMEIKEILKEFPFLTREQIQAAINYAAEKAGKTKRYKFSKLDKNYPPATPHEIYRRR